jgi:hypothetical protein
MLIHHQAARVLLLDAHIRLLLRILGMRVGAP